MKGTLSVPIDTFEVSMGCKYRKDVDKESTLVNLVQLLPPKWVDRIERERDIPFSSIERYVTYLLKVQESGVKVYLNSIDLSLLTEKGVEALLKALPSIDIDNRDVLSHLWKYKSKLPKRVIDSIIRCNAYAANA